MRATARGAAAMRAKTAGAAATGAAALVQPQEHHSHGSSRVHPRFHFGSEN
jgi:hypothetical protein